MINNKILKVQEGKINMGRVIKVSLFITIFLLMLNIASAESNASVCCEKTKTGLFCQNVPQDECAQASKTAPTACSSTSYCKPGVCYNSLEGTCLTNTPQLVCENNGGTWSEKQPAACNLGCCVLGDQAAFVSLTRCKYLSSVYGININYKSNVNDEISCVLEVTNQDKGACVFDSDFQTTCKFTTREQCKLGFNGTAADGQFFKDRLCTNEELNTNCAPTKNTGCADGKDEVYFLDSCGNTANIYDASMIPTDDSLKNNKVVREYWNVVKPKNESCNLNSGSNPTAYSKTCGNCNYISGSYCRPADKGQVSYGDYYCANLNCENTQNGNDYKHGESWCVYDDAGKTGEGKNAVGSQFFKHICINGEEVLEACADFRQQECIEDVIDYSGGEFHQAACRVNRWQDCASQTEQIDCENTDQRDCIWKADMYSVNNTKGVCVPKNSPGLEFWQGEDAKSVCGQANFECKVTYEKGLFGGQECVGNCQCISQTWQNDRIAYCQSLGDCGPSINWLGKLGFKDAYNITIK